MLKSSIWPKESIQTRKLAIKATDLCYTYQLADSRVERVIFWIGVFVDRVDEKQRIWFEIPRVA
jgi:hypothetical protein